VEVQNALTQEGSRRCSGHMEVICGYQSTKVKRIVRVRVMVCYLFDLLVFPRITVDTPCGSICDRFYAFGSIDVMSDMD
jgi:hypothetical protein